jgi:hypothetical protein
MRGRRVPSPMVPSRSRPDLRSARRRATNCDFPSFERQSVPVKRTPKVSRTSKRRHAVVDTPDEAPPPTELAGILDNVKATVITLLASLQAKERGLRQQLRGRATPGVKTGLSDIRLLRHWANRTLRTIEVLEHGQQAGELRTLLANLSEFSDIVHAHDAESPPGQDESR